MSQTGPLPDEAAAFTPWQKVGLSVRHDRRRGHVTTDVVVHGRYGGFGTKYGVYAQVVPFASRGVDPIAYLDQVAGCLDALPPTARYLTRHRVERHAAHAAPDLDLTPRALTDTHLFVHGAYPIPRESNQPNRHANPAYHGTHDHTVSDTAARLAWLDEYAALGLHTHPDIARHFGCSPTAVASFIADHDYDWQDAKRAGMRTTARTWKLCHAWGYDYTTLARAFGLDASTLRTRVSRYARAFEPPADPSRGAEASPDGGATDA